MNESQLKIRQVSRLCNIKLCYFISSNTHQLNKGGCNINLWDRLCIAGGVRLFFHLLKGGVRHYFYLPEGGVKHFLSTLSVAYSTYLTLLQSNDNYQLFKISRFAHSIFTSDVYYKKHDLLEITLDAWKNEIYKC